MVASAFDVTNVTAFRIGEEIVYGTAGGVISRANGYITITNSSSKFKTNGIIPTRAIQYLLTKFSVRAWTSPATGEIRKLFDFNFANVTGLTIAAKEDGTGKYKLAIMDGNTEEAVGGLQLDVGTGAAQEYYLLIRWKAGGDCKIAYGASPLTYWDAETTAIFGAGLKVNSVVLGQTGNTNITWRCFGLVVVDAATGAFRPKAASTLVFGRSTLLDGTPAVDEWPDGGTPKVDRIDDWENQDDTDTDLTSNTTDMSAAGEHKDQSHLLAALTVANLKGMHLRCFMKTVADDKALDFGLIEIDSAGNRTDGGEITVIVAGSYGGYTTAFPKNPSGNDWESGDIDANGDLEIGYEATGTDPDIVNARVTALTAEFAGFEFDEEPEPAAGAVAIRDYPRGETRGNLRGAIG